VARRIVITVIGTQGDVQPFVALAIRLKKRGFSVALCSTRDFAPMAELHGIEFHDLGGDAQEFLRQAQFDNFMTKRSILYAPALMRAGQKVLREASRRAWQIAQNADALIFQNVTSFCIDIAEALHIPAILTVFQPIYPTSEFPYFDLGLPPMDPLLFRFNREPFAKSPSVDPFINKLSYMVQTAQQTYWDSPRDALRSVLGLRRKKKGNVHTSARGEPLTTLHAYSPTISPAPGDWSENNIITGFWKLDDVTGWTPPPDFQEFLAKGDMPIYIGFGSMSFGAQRNSEIIGKALKQWGGRALVSKGWGGLKADAMPENVFVIERAPHSKLFDHVKAVVHHGGAGTTHTGLMAGRPTFVVPQFFDQPYWGQRIYDLGAGPPPVRLRKLTTSLLAGALEDLDTTPAYMRASAALGEKLRLEDGTSLAVDVIEETIADFGARPPARTYHLSGAAT
jgi:UDP:flavonoid glycosyltransferase YjiC (YdhE family)